MASFWDNYVNGNLGFEKNPFFQRVSRTAGALGGNDPLNAVNDFSRGNIAGGIRNSLVTGLDVGGGLAAKSGNLLRGGYGIVAKAGSKTPLLSTAAKFGVNGLNYAHKIGDTVSGAFDPTSPAYKTPINSAGNIKYGPNGESLIPGTAQYAAAPTNVPIPSFNNITSFPIAAPKTIAPTTPSIANQPGYLSPDQALAYAQQKQAAQEQYNAMLAQVKQQNAAATLGTQEQITANNRSASGQAVDLGNSAADLGMGSFGGVPVAQNQMYNTTNYQNLLANRQLGSTIASNNTNAQVQKSALAQALASIALDQANAKQANANNQFYSQTGITNTL